MEVEKTLEELEQTEKELEEKQQELERAKNEISDYENKKSALEKELARIQEQIKKSREAKRIEEKTFAEKLREENLQKAKEKIIKEFGYEKPEDINKLLETFNRIDDGSLTEDRIYENLLKSHLVLNSNKYVEIEKKIKEMEKAAEGLMAEMSSSSMVGNQPSNNLEVQLTKEDIEAAKWAGIPLEKYKELKLKGKI